MSDRDDAASDLVYVHCSCGGRIREPFLVAESVYSVPKTHRRSRGSRTCRIIVTVFPDGSAGVEPVPDDRSFEDVLSTHGEAA